MKKTVNGTNDIFMLYSPEDHDWISNLTISLDKGYCVTKIDGNPKRIHRLVIKAEKGKIVDHINNNRLDNRRENLIITTYQIPCFVLF